MNIASIRTNQNTYATLRSSTNVVSNSITKADLSNIYAQSGISSSLESSDKKIDEFRNEDFYSELEARAVSSAEYIAKQKEKFVDMYVTSAAHKYFSDNRLKVASSLGLLTLRVENARIASKEECMLIPIEAGELPQFMDMVQSSLKNGMSLEDILKQKYDEHIAKYGEEGHTGSFADWFAINTSTGEVMSADPISRTYHGDSLDEETLDVEAVMELADDLATFLRYAVFSQETDDLKKVDELLSFIKNKQTYANYDRFMADGDDGTTDNDIIERLIAAGVLKDDDEEEEKEEAVDELMEAIRIHQEELGENKIDMKGSERTIAEIQEIIDGETKR